MIKMRTLFRIHTLLFALCFSLGMMAQSKIYYVSPASSGNGDGSSWANATTLADALTAAQAGDQIWVQGFEQITDPAQLYIAPSGGFSVKSGVQLYGGFKGDETNINGRETLGKPYQLKYRSVLSGDISKDDNSDNTNLIFPANTTRSDNATHVLTLNMDPKSSGNNNTYPTVVNGFTITGGQADGTDEKGGGIYIYGDNSNGGNFRIERCFLFNNYATQGGAVYVSSEVQNRNNGESLINQCVIYNNAAGERAAVENQGGGVYLDGTATVVNTSIFNNENGGVRLSSGSKVVNATIARNTGAGVDLTTAPNSTNVYNSIIWGNTSLSAEHQPGFKNSAFHEVAADDGNGNIYVSKENRGDATAPMFDAPSLKTSYDRDFNWRKTAYPLWSWKVLEGSVMIDKGDGAYEDAYGNEDMAGNPRKSGTSIDIGAYEFQNMPASRIRYVRQGATGDGSSWDNASGDLQKMIDELAESTPSQTGEVWVAAGTYTPQSQLISGTAYSASFRMRDGISVYGGFAGTESSKLERVKKDASTMPWDFKNETVLEAAYYDHTDLAWTGSKWTLSSDSRHVVWFAPMSGEPAFTTVTTLDGFTIQGGYAQGGTGQDNFLTDRGAGVYMDGSNAYLSNCIVRENYATGNGGGVYLKDGRVQTSLIYNNNADADGGAVYVENTGLVQRSMLTNNSAHNGAGAYLYNNTAEGGNSGEDHPEYLILSTCVVSNNTVTGNGAVYCDKGGVLMQNTITNNNCITATDATDSKASQTGGIYVDEYALVLNSVLWNNQMLGGTNIPMYARNPSAANVRFLYNAISGVNNAVWNNTLQEQTLSLVDENAGKQDDGTSIEPRFTEPSAEMQFDLESNYGVQAGWKDGLISYYWKPVDGSNLWARGMALGQLPNEVVLAPEVDIEGAVFAQKPAVGAFHVKAPAIRHATETDGSLVVYVEINCTEPSHDGSSWGTAFRSLNDALSYLAGLDKTTVGGNKLVVRVLEGDIWPRYAFTNNDPKTATITVPVTVSGETIYIYGGYHRTTDNNTVVRDPLTYRSVINGNPEGKDITAGLYHCITVAQGAKLVLDGFHVINGYAAGEASRQYGAGLLAHAGSTVTVRNCIFENNTAQEGAAIDAREATLTMQNCVVNNNTNTTETTSVITAKTLTMEHVTVANNVGAAPATMGASSFSVGNTNGNSLLSLASTGADGAKNFANPTNKAGATLGFDTYLGGYSSFRPLTSSADAGKDIINKASASTSLTTDITVVNDRNLGGVPDLGAYEADLPKSGRVYYVRTTGSDNNTGLSWDRAFATVRKAVETASKGAVINGEKPQVWVAAGTYKQTPKSNSVNCFEILEGVDVYGAFPKTGNPGMNDRHPFISTSVFNNYEDIYKPEDYETILKPASTSGNRRVLGQADTYNPIKNGHLSFTNETIWDGFTLTSGYLDSKSLSYLDGNGKRNGGAGAAIFTNVILKNCIVTKNKNTITRSIQYTYKEIRGGGIYCDEGTLENCYILSNQLVNELSGDATAYGGGAYMYNGTAYNCVISNNQASGEYTDGAGIFIESGEFFNNTIVANASNGTKRGNGGICVYYNADDHKQDEITQLDSRLRVYNCISIANTSYKRGTLVGYDDAAANGGAMDCYNSIFGVKPSNQSKGSASIGFINCDGGTTENLFANYAEGNYRLKANAIALNKGENIPVVNGVEIDLAEYTDMDFTDRIKDCTIDIGAYELTNTTTTPDVDTQKATATYYVTQNGNGTASASSEENAACAMKLQTVLNAAGQYKQQHPDYQVIVKVAGYSESGTGFVYHANTLANANDPQSYSYTVPYGVELQGGYSDQDADWDDEGSRDIMTNRTVLSAIKSATTTQQEVNGYHVVTFGEKPTDWTGTTDAQTIIDGVWLEDGSATSLTGAGNPNTRGGGAIVPSGAHVRNCVVRNCAATEGGGLYLMPGATVSGTLIMNNSAENGGGVYADATSADNTLVDADSRAHILSSTIAGNTASTSGGGLYMEAGAVMNVNTVIFGNTAGSDKNVSGVTNMPFTDNKLGAVYGITNKTDFYPFNDCFVETQEMPSDFENTRLESDSTLYFTGDYYQLKDYSLLIKHGLKNEYQEKETQADPSLVTTFNVAKSDMQNIARVQTGNGAERLDAGAFAYDGGILPTELFTRIFVSQTTNVTLTEGSMSDYLGRSFYTSFSTLEDALGYIRYMRGSAKKADDNTHFEILVAGGTYKPTNMRTTTAQVSHNQRLYSFEVPQNVSIYGGFKGDEDYSSGGVRSIPAEGGEKVVSNMGDITTILSKRDYSDFNQNGINEPWELANQTILSGQINASSTAQNAYHVVFTDKGDATTANPVVLNGLTVMYGQTDNVLSSITNNNEQGRGGGIYSNGVTYTISRCRLIDNTAVRGGAVFVRDADLNLSGCILAGNETVANKSTDNTLASRGGAAYVSGISMAVNLRAANTLWANNESAGEGGAIGTNYAEGVSSSHDPLLYIMNNTFVRNKAITNPVIYTHNGKSSIVNTLLWGNQGDYQNTTNLSIISNVSYCASDVDYVNKFASGKTNNILLSTDNMGDKGPRLTKPSVVAGVDGNSASSLWNPVAISVLTDAGDGTEHTTLLYPGESETDHSEDQTTGAYQDWFTKNADVKEAYITGGNYSRYSGPYGENNTPMCKPIDIGLYEYQYVSNFSTMPAIYVATLSAGNGSGDSWANATDDLRGAIVGAANPTQTGGDRVIYVRDGDYSWSRLSAGSAYVLNMSGSELSKSLTLKGSCTGSGELQDFSKPTVIRNDGATTTLMSVAANAKTVTFEGFTFINNTGTGMDASAETDGSLTLKNCGFRISPIGLNISGNNSNVLIYNTLFADGGTGLVANGNTTVVNATFAQNTTADLTGAPAVYNSVAWKNTKQNLTDGTNNNVAIDGTVANDNVQEGPNFVDPLNANAESRDYHIRPSVKLLNKGSNDHYKNYALGLTAADAVFPEDEVDLGNNARLVDNSIDVGAYEYEAPLQPIVYVKADLTGTADGKSWETALGDLQGAVDLAGLYALNHQDATGYVFVHGNYHGTDNLNITLKNAKIYGGMNDERSDEALADDFSNTAKVVESLLGKRKGMLEATSRSSLQNVTLGADAVVDGFVVNGTATVNDGALSTSVVKNDVSGEADGLLYNSLVLGDGTADHPGNVSGVKTVNVTAVGTITGADGSGNNRASVSETNAYVTDDYWKYQLMETSSDIDPTDTRTNISGYMMKVGHERDLIGNQRIRNNKVDNGCFETWNIISDAQITADDKPVGQSVVYVRKNQELKIQNASDGTLVYKDATSSFTPGYLLLEHHAGLRGNGNYISLTNLAVERDVAKGGNDLAAMPFKVTGISSYGTDGTNESYELKRYSGSKRAAYDYTFDSDNGGAWTDQYFDGGGETEGFTDQNFSNRGETEGFLIKNSNTAASITVRFYGKSEDQNDAIYKEGGTTVKSVVLMKYNFNEPWTSTSTGGNNRFTHKENMSWNLFGSPYLCAMNYSDMEYGRVIYGYDKYDKGGYKTINTSNETSGYVPAGDAVFTQTATLKDNETLNISASAQKEGSPYAAAANLSIGISRAGATRAEDSACDDVLQLNAVPADEARNDFDIASDGVKWMAADSTAQLYATRSGARYSLLSAVSERGTVAVDVTLPEAGMYTFSIPATCDAGNYESVVLKDAKTGKQADLLEGGYDFTSVEAGTVSGRFTISFNRMLDDDKNASIRAWSPSRDKVSVSGVEAGDRIAVYSTAGVMSASCMAASSTETLQAAVSGVAIVEVTRDGKKIAVRKIRMR